MDKNRAKQILNSKDRIDVFYQGTPVWIEDVNDKDVAQITLLSGAKQRMDVSVNWLSEKE